jgi:Zn-dependent peptidase ImmA (M78 family)
MTWLEHLGRESPDYTLVKAAVERSLAENSIYSPPVPAVEIAKNNGIRVYFAEFPSTQSEVSGFFDFKNNSIYVNRDEPAGRQTFTVAHELGHALLHGKLFRVHPEDYKVLLRAPIRAASDPLEKEANAFAAELLVPEKMLQHYSKIGSIPELARLFNVSEEVIRFRMTYESEYATI